MSRAEMNLAGCAVTFMIVLAACGRDTSSSTPSDDGDGRRLYRSLGCNGCHTTTGQDGVGPTWRGLAGSYVTLVDGSVVIADSAYLERSIREPAAQLVAQFPTPMPQLSLSDADVAALIAYIKSLG